jgi:hypothetical protein
MRLPKLLFVLRSLLLTTLSFCVSADCTVNDQDDNSTKRTRLAQVFSSNGSANPIGQFRLGIETRKSLQTPEYLRRSDCADDDECEEYSGLPRSQPGKMTVKNLKKPFIGLSITTPLQ